MADIDSIPLSAEKARELFIYDADAGTFCRRKTLKQVGSDDMYGYKTVRIGKKSYKLHRLAWLYVYGKWPNGDIDHINGVRDDNRIANLRDVDRGTNLQNQRVPKNNKSTGVMGVYPSRGCRFTAALSINNRKRSLGTFDTLQQAQQAYIAAKQAMHPGYVTPEMLQE